MHDMPALGQVCGPAPGATGGVERLAWWIAIQDVPHSGLVQVDERIGTAVVGARPDGVALGGRSVLPVGVPLQGGVSPVVQDLAHLRDPRVEKGFATQFSDARAE